MRTIILGDIHGFNYTLCKLLEKVKLNTGTDRLVLLGDLFDRGPDSHEVYRTVQRLQKQFGPNFTLLRGNHEDYLLQPRLTRKERMIWENVGRQMTVYSFRKAGEVMEETIPWLKEYTQLYYKTKEFQCVHAGIRVDPPEVNDLQTLVHDHDTVLENQYTGLLTVTGHIALEKATWFAGNGETRVEIRDGEIHSLPETGVLCIDTGCGKGGRLTAMVINEQEYIMFSESEK